MSPGARRALSFVLLLGSLTVSLLGSEMLLRVVFPGGGRLTQGAPGGQNFEHLAIDGARQRGRLSYGTKPPGVPRIMVLGDSVTWGWGVRRWEDTWPEQLALLFEAQGRPHELAVLAEPGRNIDGHVSTLRQWADDVRPDVLIYQWYVNDIEQWSERPATARWWQAYPWHEPLRASYLYSFLDSRLSALLPVSGRTYLDYLLTDFEPGGPEWTEFERQFHALAIRAAAHAQRRLLVLYPMVPFSGDYPLRPVHDRMHRLAGARAISIPPMTWTRLAGALVPRADAPWKQVVTLPVGSRAQAVMTRGGYAASGAVDMTVRFAAAGAEAGRAVATVDVLDADGGAVVASDALVSRTEGAAWQESRHRLALPAGVDREVRIAIGAVDYVALDVAAIELNVDYGFEVLDLAGVLNTFDTHVSMFDAHPNPRAHRVVAEQVFNRLTATPARD